jgi:hypothetical protein
MGNLANTLRDQGNLANTLRDQGDLPGARLLQEQVLEVSRRIRGEEHPDMLTAMSDLAFTLHNQSDLPRAHSLRLQVLETRRRILGEMHPQTLSAMTNLATTLLKLGETDQARVLRAEVHSIHRKASSSTEGDTTMRLTETLKQWLVEQEWNEVPEIDVDNQTSSTGFGFTVGDFSLKCWFDINEKTQVCKFFAYFLDTKAPEKKLDEVQKFVTAVSNGMVLGNLQLLHEDRTIRYYNAIDVENATFEPAHIQNLLNAGLHAMDNWLPKYVAICFGGKTAEEVLAEDE